MLIWLGLTNRLTATVAPALETIADTLADLARSTGPIGITSAENAVGEFVKTVSFPVDESWGLPPASGIGPLRSR